MSARVKRIKNRDKLEALLYRLNDRGIMPNVGVLVDGSHTEVLYAYGTDEGDTMGFAWFRDPGEDATWCEASDDHLVFPPLSWDDFPEGPYTVLYQDGRSAEGGSR